MNKLLEVKNLSKQYITKPHPFKEIKTVALDQLSFSLEPYQTLSLIGETGSGKSILAKLLAGAEKPTSGEIYLNGKQLDPNNLRQRTKHIRMIFQDSATSLNPSLSIGQILDEPLKLNTLMSPKERTDKIKKTLSRVGLLADYMKFHPNMLSSGQKQRVALARALILDPQIIIADKPFAAMDPSTRSQMVNLFLELQETFGLTYIFVSHNLNIVKHISDYVFVMEQGKVVEQGETVSLFENPKHTVTRKLMHSQQLLKAV